MDIIHSSRIPSTIPHWAFQLAELTRMAWTGSDGKCYFPYLPLTQETEWLSNIAQAWAEGRMHSWVLHDQGKILSHAALINRGSYWELGRLVAHNAPPGGTHTLCKERLAFCRKEGINARMECTQAHIRSQEHAMMVGMRFAGIGFLDVIDGVNWDIIFFDTLSSTPFSPRPGVLGDPLGKTLYCEEKDRARLREISHILTTDRGGGLPPKYFHIHPELFLPVQQIILLNTLATRH